MLVDRFFVFSFDRYRNVSTVDIHLNVLFFGTRDISRHEISMFIFPDIDRQREGLILRLRQWFDHDATQKVIQRGITNNSHLILLKEIGMDLMWVFASIFQEAEFADAVRARFWYSLVSGSRYDETSAKSRVGCIAQARGHRQ